MEAGTQKVARNLEQRLMSDPVIQGIFADFPRMNREREAAAAKADPAKHKLSRVFNDSRYRFYDAGRNGRGQVVRFCYSSHRNVAGYFLGWREIEGKKQTKRDQWTARKTRTAVVDIARNRYNKFIAKAAA
jgi:hypothetical protein